MAKIKQKKFLQSIAIDMDKSINTVEKFYNAFVDRLFKELLRDNTVDLNDLGTFEVVFCNEGIGNIPRGNVVTEYYSKAKYILKLRTTKKAQAKLNDLSDINLEKITKDMVDKYNTLEAKDGKADMRKMFSILKEEREKQVLETEAKNNKSFNDREYQKQTAKEVAKKNFKND